MAKAREIPGLTTDLPYGETAARVLEVRTEELIEHSEGVLDMTDIERVHAMRVATRRLRAAIEVFRPCFPKEQGKAVLNEVKALADALGERRDPDVAILALDAFAAAMPAPDRPGIRSIVDGFRAEQEQANVDLVPFVEEARLDELRERLLGLAAAAREAVEDVDPDLGEEPGRVRCLRTARRYAVKAKKVKQLDPRTTLAENAARIVLVRVGELRSFVPEALDPDESETQHDLRIAAKRLRYVLEATGFCFGRPATTALPPREGAPGHARRDPRRRRDAAARPRAPRADCGARTPRTSAAGPGTPRTSIRSSPLALPTGRPTAASRCSRSTSSPAVTLLFERFVEPLGGDASRRASGRASSGRPSASSSAPRRLAPWPSAPSAPGSRSPTAEERRREAEELAAQAAAELADGRARRLLGVRAFTDPFTSSFAGISRAGRRRRRILASNERINRGSNDDPPDSSRADLHCHSTASQISKLGVQRSAGLPECATPPEEVYELAKRRGMDFVTITDHDTIDGALEIADRPDVFISEELTASFAGEPQAVHVLCFGITPDDHEWLQAHAGDVEECAEYLHGNRIACALAHPFYALAAPLEPRHRRRLARLFEVWETRNGSRAHELNMPAAVYVDTHGGIGVGGSDDHAGRRHRPHVHPHAATPRPPRRSSRTSAPAAPRPTASRAAPRSGRTPRSRSRRAA